MVGCYIDHSTFKKAVEVRRSWYSKSLKTLLSWAIDREIFLTESEKLRARFDAERYCTPGRASYVLKEAKKELYKMTHPDPYCVPYMPGGSLFMRNPPIPLEICFPDGNLPSDAPKITFNTDMTVSKVETGKNAVSVKIICTDLIV